MHRSEKAAMSVRFRPSAPREGSSEVERLVANEKVAGSSPVPRSSTRMWRNWQTRSVQNAVLERACEFKSHHPHHLPQCTSGSVQFDKEVFVI